MPKIAIISALLLALFAGSLAAQAPAKPLTKADIDRMMKELSNWGRWGKEDQMGTVNLITAASRKAAVKLVTEGVSVSMARDTNSKKDLDNPNPFVVKMSPPVGGEFNMDEQTVFFHGFAVSHLDSLAHIFFDGDKMYNGFPTSAVKPDGTGALDVRAYKNGFLTRGVLIDIPWLKGLPYLEPGTAIYPEDIAAWEKKTGIRIGSGDAVFIRTGRWGYRDAKGPWDISSKAAGIYASCVPLLKQRDIAILGSDAAHDVVPSGVEGADFPVHELLIGAMGVALFDQLNLEDIAKAAEARKRWTFLFTAAPVRVVGGTGAAINPIATF